MATGDGTELGAIAGLIRSEESTATPLQQRMSRFAKLIGVVVAVASLVAFGTGVMLGESIHDMFLVSVALAVSAVPEGSTVAGGFLEDEEPAVVEDGSALHHCLLAGVLASEAEAYRRDGTIAAVGDPTEVALLVAAMTVGIEPEEARTADPVIAETPFEPIRRYSATLRAHRGRHRVYAKGAPERIAAMCTHMLTDDGLVAFDHHQMADAAQQLAAARLRVLAVAIGDIGPRSRPSFGEDPEDLVLVGLQGMMDPPRPGVRDAIAACHDAGIRVLMITGDHAVTASAISRRLGIDDNRVLAGAELDSMPDEQLRSAVAEVSVFARVSPEQKLRIVNASQDRGEVVAVTGDGVNDAPALKAAQIGVAMGRGGTDIAREAADMVLTDDNFVSITAAVEEGRVTFDNIRKVTFFLVSTGAATIAAIVTAVWLQWPLILLPAQLLWLNLVTNGVQDVALAFEPGSRNALRRPPRPTNEGTLSRTMWERTVVAGVVMAAGTLLMFRWELDASGSLARAQTVALTTMVVYQMFQAGNARSEQVSLFRLSPWSNPLLFAATALALGIHAAALYLPPTQYVLRVEPIDATTWLRILAVATTILVAMEAHKAVRRRKRVPPSPTSFETRPRAVSRTPMALGRLDG